MRISPKHLLILVVLAGALLFFGQRENFPVGQPEPDMMVAQTRPMEGEIAMAPAKLALSNMAQDSRTSSYPPMPPGSNGNPVVGGQMYLQDTSLSLVARDPVATEQQVLQITTELGGFLVSSSLHRPEEGTTATVLVRVPTEKLDEALRRFESASDRVVSKSVQGRDVTQAYQDLDAKLVTLAATQVRLEELFDRATEASDLLQIQQQISMIQDQKDSLEGQRRYLSESAKLSLVSLYLASDELALPYLPAQPWQPEAIFRQAVRSLVAGTRQVGTILIWGVVYLPVFLPIVLIFWWLKRRTK